jgi:predicted MFS family arabinose efflux permease
LHKEARMTATALPSLPALPGQRLSPTVRAVVVPFVLFGMYASFGAAWMAVVPLFPELITAFHVDAADAAWLVTIVSLVKSFVPILAGLFAARAGLTTSMRLAALLMATAVVVPWLPGFATVVAARFVFGIGGAMWLALMGAVVVDAVAPGRRGFVNAINGVAVNAGVIVGLKTALPLKDALGHQAAWTVLSAGTVVFAALVFLCGPLSTTTTTTTQAPLSDVFRGYGRVLGDKTTWVVAAAFAGPLALYLVMNTWLPTHLQATFGMTRPEAASWLSTMNVWGIPASLVIGLMLQRNIGPVRLHIVVGALLLPLGVFGALTADATWRPLVFCVAGVGMFLPVAPLVTLLQKQPGMTAARVGMVMGTMGSVTYVVSSVAPNLVGHFVAGGMTIRSLLLPCCLLGLTPVVALLLPEPRD